MGPGSHPPQSSLGLPTNTLNRIKIVTHTSKVGYYEIFTHIDFLESS